MSHETVYSAYKKIHTGWNTNESFSELYHMIVNWMEIWTPEKVHPECAELLHEYGERCNNGDDIHDLIEDFIYGSRYKLLRDLFLKK
jgi:hypothetical protein